MTSLLCYPGHRECMEILVANDVDIDQEDSQHGTPLYVACMYQRTDCVKKLLELGALGAEEGKLNISEATTYCFSLIPPHS